MVKVFWGDIVLCKELCENIKKSAPVIIIYVKKENKLLGFYYH